MFSLEEPEDQHNELKEGVRVRRLDDSTLNASRSEILPHLSMAGKLPKLPRFGSN
jgi:hypothetical protein